MGNSIKQTAFASESVISPLKVCSKLWNHCLPPFATSTDVTESGTLRSPPPFPATRKGWTNTRGEWETFSSFTLSCSYCATAVFTLKDFIFVTSTFSPTLLQHWTVVKNVSVMFLTNKIQIFLICLDDAVIDVHATFSRFNLADVIFLGSDEKKFARWRCRGHCEEAGRNPADFRGQPHCPRAAPAGPQTGRSALGLRRWTSFRLKWAHPGRWGSIRAFLTDLWSHPGKTKS